MAVIGKIERTFTTSKEYEASLNKLGAEVFLEVDGWYIAKITKDGKLQLCSRVPQSDTVLDIDPCTGKIKLA